MLKINPSCCDQWLDFILQKGTLGPETSKYLPHQNYPIGKSLSEAKQPQTQNEIHIQNVEGEITNAKWRNGCFVFSLFVCLFCSLYEHYHQCCFSALQINFGRNPVVINK